MSDYSDYSDCDSAPPITLSYVSEGDRSARIREESSQSSDDDRDAKQRKKEISKLAKKAAESDDPSSEEANDPFYDPPAPDTNDFLLDQDEEYRLWAERETQRLRDELRAVAQEARDRAVTRKQSAMSDIELAKLKREQRPRQRGHMKFMQKYYHVGAFQIGSDTARAQELLQRDYTTAVGDDLLDKTLLPDEMLVRGDDFGKKGRTKWTHLANEDTTTRESRREQRMLKDLDES